MTDRELMQQALEAMEHLHRTGDTQVFDMYAAPEIIPALRERLAQPEKEPVAWMTINAYGEEDDIHYENPEGHLLEGWTYKPLYTHPLSVQPQPVKLRRGDILRCSETDELCTVWSTSTTGKTLVKWNANDFGSYTAEQIGELFWLEPKPEQEPVAIDGNTSDGYHTFNELYEFRKAYNAALFNEWAAGGKCSVHKSWLHHDGELCFGGGWFIVVAVLPDGQISNHYEAKDWDLFAVPETERALFEFDGHTGADVVERLKAYITPPAAQPAMFGPMGTVGDLFDKHVIANGNLKKEWIVYLEKNT